MILVGILVHTCAEYLFGAVVGARSFRWPQSLTWATGWLLQEFDEGQELLLLAWGQRCQDRAGPDGRLNWHFLATDWNLMRLQLLGQAPDLPTIPTRRAVQAELARQAGQLHR